MIGALQIIGIRMVVSLINNFYISNELSYKNLYLKKNSDRREPGETKLSFKSVKFQLRKLRDRTYPKKPVEKKGETPFDVHKKYTALINEPKVLEEFGRTLDKVHKLYFGSVVRYDYTFHVFASTRIIELIESCITKEKLKRKYLIDGTFRIVPRLFYQLLIITVEYKNDVRIKNFVCIKF